MTTKGTWNSEGSVRRGDGEAEPRPDRYNALGARIVGELGEALDMVESGGDTRVMTNIPEGRASCGYSPLWALWFIRGCTASRARFRSIAILRLLLPPPAIYCYGERE